MNKATNYYCPQCNKNINLIVKKNKKFCPCKNKINLKNHITIQKKINNLVKDYFDLDKPKKFEFRFIN